MVHIRHARTQNNAATRDAADVSLTASAGIRHSQELGAATGEPSGGMVHVRNARTEEGAATQDAAEGFAARLAGDGALINRRPVKQASGAGNLRHRADLVATALLNRLGAALLLVLFLPVIVVLAILIRLDSPGSVFFRCRRVGRDGKEFGMLKFRKMHAGASGIELTSPDDERFTRLGRMLAKSKLDELPQLWNVLRGEMSLVGPRPEDLRFVRLQAEAYEQICRVNPGITGLTQLAFACESEILNPDDRVGHYVERLLPEKIRLDRLYSERRSIVMDLRILAWTIVPVLFRRDVSVHRESGRLKVRRRPVPAPSAAVEVAQG